MFAQYSKGLRWEQCPHLAPHRGPCALSKVFLGGQVGFTAGTSYAPRMSCPVGQVVTWYSWHPNAFQLIWTREENEADEL